MGQKRFRRKEPISILNMRTEERFKGVCKDSFCNMWVISCRSLLLLVIVRYQAVNQNPSIEEGQTTQCAKENEQKDKQRSTKHTDTAKDRVTRTPLKT
jgi:hypothetical protein